MKIAIFGANGDSGGEIMNAVLERGHNVVACVRRPETITVRRLKMSKFEKSI